MLPQRKDSSPSIYSNQDSCVSGCFYDKTGNTKIISCDKFGSLVV